MKNLFFSTLSEHIGFTLLHSLWQGMIGVILIILVSRLVSSKYSTLRYWLFVSVMLIVFVANLITLSNHILRSTGTIESNPVTSLAKTLGVGEFTYTSIGLSSVTSYWLSNVQHIVPYFVMLWWLGMLTLFIRLVINLWQVRLLSRAAHLPVSDTVMEIFKRVMSRLNITKIVQLGQSKQILVPSVIGYLKPIILLPIGLVNGLTNDQVEAILLHELSHIKRNDFLINIIQSVVEVIYFFNPFIWIISKAIRDEREHACDDTAISSGISASDYAQTLAGVFNYATKRQQLALSFTSKNKLTLKRIQRIMKNQSNNNNKLLASIVFVTAITLSMYYGAQSHAPGQDISEVLADRTVMAMALPSFSNLASPLPKLIKEKSMVEEYIQQDQVVVSDTTDPKALKKRTEEYERAMDGLKATKEWQEVEQLRKVMLKEQMSIMIELGPLMEDAMRLAEESMEVDIIEIQEIEEKLERISEHMAQVEISEELQVALELSTIEIEESMRHMQVQIAEIDFGEVEKVAQVMAKEAKMYAAEAAVMAIEAEKIAAEAKKQVEAVEDFFDELKPLLIEDGYIKSSDDLDQLKFKDDSVFVNGEKVKAKDAKKYIKIRDKYFAGDDNFSMN
jgi:bla regulator protein BlaR1